MAINCSNQSKVSFKNVILGTLIIFDYSLLKLGTYLVEAMIGRTIEAIIYGNKIKDSGRERKRRKEEEKKSGREEERGRERKREQVAILPITCRGLLVM